MCADNPDGLDRSCFLSAGLRERSFKVEHRSSIVLPAQDVIIFMSGSFRLREYLCNHLVRAPAVDLPAVKQGLSAAAYRFS